MIVYNEIDPYACAWLQNLTTAEVIAAGEVIEEDIQKFNPDLVRNATQFHAFAGIGVWSYALRLAGWPDDVPVWTGSCPCQPFSIAGQRKGIEDARHLWPDWYTLIEQCRPPVVLGEQVASPAGRSWLANVQADLEALGYSFGAADLCAAGVGAPHIRQRLYFVGIAHGLLSKQFEGLWTGPGGAQVGGTCGQPAGPGENGGVANSCSERRQQESRSASGDETEDGGTRRHAREQEGDNIFTGNGKDSVALSNPDGSQSLTPSRVHDQGAQRDDVARRGEHGLLGNPQVGRGRARDGEPEQGREPQGKAGGPGVLDELGNTCCEGLPSRECEALRGERGREEGRAVVQPGSPFDFWADAEWLFCTDGKARPVEPGTFPLAHGTTPDMGSDRPGEASPFRVIQDPKTGRSIGQNPWRIGMLKGYGNAIVAQAAAVFIQTIKEAIHEIIHTNENHKRRLRSQPLQADRGQ